MTDFHSHLLPGIDDGSDSVGTSLSMLKSWKDQGITRIAATPHFYAEQTNPARFLSDRQSAYERLTEAMARNGIEAELLLGAEVRYFNGISTADALDDLCLNGTRLLLLEMPFDSIWTEHMLREVAEIPRRGVIPVAAHIERYLSIQPRRLVRQFLELDILIQSNAEFFLSRRTAKTALRMLADGRIHFLGSDAHNSTERPPNLGPAFTLIRQRLGRQTLERLSAYERLTYPESENIP